MVTVIGWGAFMAENQEPGRIKTAFELAMEKIKNLESPSKEKRLEWKGVPEGNRLAADFLKGNGDLAAAVQKADSETRRYVMQGVVEVLAANIQLPRTDAAQKATDRALEGVKALFQKKPKLKEIVERVQYVSNQYRTYGAQQRQQVYDHLKREFMGQVQEALRQKGVTGDVAVNIETTPEFQQEWMRAKVRLDEQYEQHLEACRNEVKALV